MSAPHVETPWSTSLPPQYRDRIHWDAQSGLPASIDVTAGPYTVPGNFTAADRIACGLPPAIARPWGWR